MKPCLILASVVWCCGAVFGENSDTIRVGVLTDGISEYWTEVREVMLNSKKEMRIDLDFRMPASPTVEQQKALAQQMIAAGVKALAICPVAPGEQRDFMDDVSSQIPIATLCKDVPDSKRRLYLGRDETEAGRLLAKTVAKCIPEGLQVMAFCGSKEDPQIAQRLAGFKEELGKTETMLSNIMEDHGDRMLAWANMDDVLQKHPEISAFIGCQEYHGPAMLRAVKEQERTHIVQIVSFGAAPSMMQAVNDGTVCGIVQDDAAGGAQLTLQTLAALARGAAAPGIPESGTIAMPLKTIEMTTAKSKQEIIDDIKVQIPWLSETAPSAP